MSGAAQLALFDAPTVACTRTLADLVGECAATGYLPLWAQIAGEAWFQRAYRACDRERWIARLAHVAFGRSVYDEDERFWETSCLECREQSAAAPDTIVCASCAALVRDVVGDVTLEMVRVGLDLKRGVR